MQKYELWHSEQEGSLAFFEASDERGRDLIPDDAQLILVVEAESWEEAQAKKHDFLGWEPYKPMNENGGD